MTRKTSAYVTEKTLKSLKKKTIKKEKKCRLINMAFWTKLWKMDSSEVEIKDEKKYFCPLCQVSFCCQKASDSYDCS